jgi:hypothetical protein
MVEYSWKEKKEKKTRVTISLFHTGLIIIIIIIIFRAPWLLQSAPVKYTGRSNNSNNKEQSNNNTTHTHTQKEELKMDGWAGIFLRHFVRLLDVYSTVVALCTKLYFFFGLLRHESSSIFWTSSSSSSSSSSSITKTNNSNNLGGERVKDPTPDGSVPDMNKSIRPYMVPQRL